MTDEQPTGERTPDERFADHVRAAFDAYDEPPDEAVWARLHTALDAARAAPPTASPDRPALASPRAVRRRMRFAAAAVVLAVAAALSTLRPGAPPAAPPVASTPGPVQPDAPSERVAEPSPEPRGATRQEPRAVREERAAPPRLAARPPASRPAAPDRFPTATEVLPDRPSEPLALVPDTASDTSATSGPEPASGAPEASETATGRPVFVAAAPTDVAPAGPDVARAAPGAARRAGLRVVVSSAVAVSGGFAAGTAEGASLAAGVAREWRLGRGLAVSGGAELAYTRLVAAPPSAFSAAASLALGETLDVPAQSTLTTLALDLPLDLSLDVAPLPVGRGPAARLGVAVGLASSLYAVQAFRDAGQTLRGVYIDDPATGTRYLGVAAEAYETRERARPRLDVAQQLTVAARVTSPGGALAGEAFARLPLGGLTRRDLPVTAFGLRLRAALP